MTLQTLIRLFLHCSGATLSVQRCLSEMLGRYRNKYYYRKNPKNLDTRKICCNHPKIWTRWIYHRVKRQKEAEGIANSVDPDQEKSDLGRHCLPIPICPKT